jgi:hypothetical protein
VERRGRTQGSLRIVACTLAGLDDELGFLMSAPVATLILSGAREHRISP